MQDLMKKIIEILRKTYYGDVRLDRGYGVSLGKNKSEENIVTGSSFGLCIRVISDNKWYYLGFDERNDEKILDQTEKLVRRVGNKKSKLIIQDPWEADERVKVKKDPEDISTEEKLSTLREIFKRMMENKKIINASASMSYSKNQTIFLSTEGSVLKQSLPFFRLGMSGIARKDDRVESDFFVLAKQGGYELFTELNLEEKIKQVVNGSIQLLKARTIEGGRYDIIVDPEVSGVIAHESFGHGLEADQVARNRSYLAELKGKKVISGLVSIHDNGSLRGERGSMFFDDEGIKSSDTLLVENGVLRHFMHDRQSAALMNSDVTGNARAQDFSKKVFVRMTNTYIEPRDWKRDELIEDTKSGYYLIRCLTGMEDPLGGNLQLVTHKAMEIKNGELTGLFKGVGISGKVLEFLSSVDAVTDDFSLRGSGCGKGHEDYVPVSSGGPYMRVRKAIIG